jgi:hypothetical protein
MSNKYGIGSLCLLDLQNRIESTIKKKYKGTQWGSKFKTNIQLGIN